MSRAAGYWFPRLPIPAGGVAYLLFRRRYHVGDQGMQPRPTPDA